MEKKIDCWVNPALLKELTDSAGCNGSGRVYRFKGDTAAIKATLVIHDYPEQKIELTAKQIKEACEAVDYMFHNTDSILEYLGFKE